MTSEGNDFVVRNKWNGSKRLSKGSIALPQPIAFACVSFSGFGTARTYCGGGFVLSNACWGNIGDHRVSQLCEARTRRECWSQCAQHGSAAGLTPRMGSL
ncbi:MAG: hypothetical protein ACTS4Z_00625 [Candidatus Hodgkinia cicadicola]